EYAIVNGEKFGIWGGMSERERRRVRRARGLTRVREPLAAVPDTSGG
ncbi:MAG: WhiB family transcriptional regulator, partial [bacterium]|nr:WhiB family transcriptional regulator [bacterium]